MPKIELPEEPKGPYITIEGSYTAHCCFEASVLDTRPNRRQPICECLDPKEAIRIATALNQLERNKDGN